MKHILMIGLAAFVLGACGKITPDLYGGAGYGMGKNQAFEQCRHEVQRDVKRASGNMDAMLFLALEIRDSHASCMRAKGYGLIN